MAHRVSAYAEGDLDEIWLYTARESGSIEVADRLVDTVTDRFLLLASFPRLGRLRDHDLGPGYSSLVIGEYTIIYRIEKEDALILRVVHGRRDLDRILG